jgi:hypothetical protein
MARRGGLKLILVLGSYEAQLTADDFTVLTNNAKSRETFLTEVLGTVDKLNVHGVHFQWYFPGCPKVRVKLNFQYCWLFFTICGEGFRSLIMVQLSFCLCIVELPGCKED